MGGEGIPHLHAGSPRMWRLLLLLLPVLSGVLAWASFPKISQSYLAWIALVPLLAYILRIQKPTAAFGGGMVAGMVQFGASMYWIPAVLTRYGGIPPLGAFGLFLLMVAVLGSFMGLACMVTRQGMNRRGTGFLLAFLPASVALEYARSIFPFGGFPWLLAGYSQSGHLRLIQAADLVGVYGFSFLVVLVNLALVWIVLYRHRRLLAVAPAGAAAAAVALCLVYGSAQLRKWDAHQPDYRVAMLQGNLSVEDPESELKWKYVQGYLGMAEKADSANPDLLILPEAPAPVIYQFDGGYRETLSALAKRYRLGLIFNNISYQEVGNTQRYFNSAFFLDGHGEEVGRYDKIHLVPFGEYVPLQSIFFFIETISRDVGSFHPGSRYQTVVLQGHVLSALICFEAVFPELSREFVRRGSQLIVNLTNDAWYGNTSAPYQHLTMARWRAIESRRYVLRAANSGISAVIAPNGRIEVQTGLLRPDIAVGRFSFLGGNTFYIRHPGYLPILCVIITILAIFRGYGGRHARGNARKGERIGTKG
jgi:apolipoprotein N-acyltransferase